MGFVSIFDWITSYRPRNVVLNEGSVKIRSERERVREEGCYLKEVDQCRGVVRRGGSRFIDREKNIDREKEEDRRQYRNLRNTTAGMKEKGGRSINNFLNRPIGNEDENQLTEPEQKAEERMFRNLKTYDKPYKKLLYYQGPCQKNLQSP